VRVRKRPAPLALAQANNEAKRAALVERLYGTTRT
jgi:hypothetical protein